MDSKININIVQELLSTKEDGILYHRESQTLEFKESFNFAGLAEYLRDFAAFANNKGGYLIFGVKDRPRRELIGLKNNAKKQLEILDPERISGFMLENFAGNIEWKHDVVEIGELFFGVFYVCESILKPIICKKDNSKDLKNGEVYYRYGGRTQKIQYAELEAIINHRIEKHNRSWIDLVSKIGKSGPENAAILDMDKGLIEKGNSKILVVDEELAKNIQWIKEGCFDEKDGAKTLKLVGEVHPVNYIEVIKKEKINRLKEYPLSAAELVVEIKKKDATIGQNEIWKIIKENDIKSNQDYALYNFRNKSQEEEYEKSKTVPNGIPSIYKQIVVDYIIRIYKNER